MGRSLSLCLLLVFASLWTPALAVSGGQGRQEGQALFNQALRLAQQGKLREAVGIYRRLLHKQPRLAPAHYNLGLLYRMLNEPSKAEYHLKQAVALAPDQVGNRVQLFLLYLDTSHLDEAASSLQELRQKFPRYAEIAFLEGLLASARQEWETAYAKFQEARRRQPKDVRVLYHLGLVAYQLRRYQEAQNAFQQAVRLEARYLSAWKGLGLAWEALQKPGEAVAAYTRALQLAPDDLPTRLKRGNLYETLRRPQEALNDYETILRQYPRNVEAHLRAGTILLELKRYKEAERHFGIALRQFTKQEAAYWDILLSLAVCKYHQRDYSKAREYYAEILKYNPKNRRAYEGQTAVLEQQGELDLVIPLYRQWSQEFPDDPQPLLKIASHYERNYKPELADREYQALVQKFPTDLYVRHQYAEFLKRRGQYEAALKQCEEALQCEPGDQATLAIKAGVLEKLQRWEDALALYQSLYQSNPQNSAFALAMGALYEKMERWEEAILQYRALALTKPPNPLAFSRLIEIYEKHNRIEEAISAFEQYVRLQNDLPAFLPHFAFFLAQHGRVEAAIQRYEEAIRLYPKEKRLRGAYGFFLKLHKRWAEAVKQLRQLQALDPKDTWCRYHIADILQEQGQKEEAWRELEAALRINPDDIGLYPLTERLAGELNKAGEYERLLRELAVRPTQQRVATKRYVERLRTQGRSEEALRFLQACLRSYPKEPNLLELAIATLEEQKRFPEALLLYERAAAVKKEDLLLLRNWANRAEEHGTLSQAIRAYQVLVKAAPDELSAALKLANLYHKARRTGEAIDLVHEIIQSHPKNEDARKLLEKLEKGS